MNLCELVFFAVGTTLAPSPAVTNSPANQGQASSPPEPAFALGPVTVPTGTSVPLNFQHSITLCSQTIISILL